MVPIYIIEVMPARRYYLILKMPQFARAPSYGYTMNSGPLLKSILTWTAFFIGAGIADITYESPTDQCGSYTTLGRSVECCTGACLDDTHVSIITFGFPSGSLCENYENFCKDPTIPPSCGVDEVIQWTGTTNPDAGIGLCYIPITGCRWQGFQYSYSCCACPPGTRAVASSCTSLDLPTRAIVSAVRARAKASNSTRAHRPTAVETRTMSAPWETNSPAGKAA